MEAQRQRALAAASEQQLADESLRLVQPHTLHLEPNPAPETQTLHVNSIKTLHLKPYILHPTRYTLHPTPYTLHPSPYTLRS